MSADGIEQVRHSKGDGASHRELAPRMIGNMIAESPAESELTT
jgi:hypothetical protein